MSEKKTVIRYDVRGFGRSSVGDQPYSDCMDLKILLLSLGISRASIIAASNSGRIALDFALKYPDSVESLVLVGSGLGLFDPEGVKGLGEIASDFEKRISEIRRLQGW